MSIAVAKRCRCGWDGIGFHPCHAKGYTCGNPGSERYYEPHKNYSLAGAQRKMSVTQTIACDACWTEFLALADEVSR